MRLPDLDQRSGDKTLVVEPVQKVAVVLGEPHDLGRPAGCELGQRDELAVLGLLDAGIDRPAVWAALGPAQALVDALDHVLAEGVTELVGMHMRLRRRVAHEIRQEALDQPVLAHDSLRALDPSLA